MPKFEIEANGKRFEVEAPDMETAVKALSGQGPQGHANVPEFQPIGQDGKPLEGYNPQTGEMDTSKLGSFIMGANDLPVIGPAMKAGGAAIAAGVAAPLSGQSFGQTYDQMRAIQEKALRDNPKTALAGNLVGSTAILAPLGATSLGGQLLGMSGSLPARIGMSAASNAAMSGADTAIRGGGIGDIAQSAAIGGGIGGAIPAVGAVLKGAGSAIADRVGSFVGGAVNPAGEAGRRVARALATDKKIPGATLSQADIAAAARNGQPLMNADLGGETTRALARAAANQSPGARGAMERIVSDRFADQGSRVGRLVSRLTGGKTDDLMMIDGLRDMASAANKPAYNKAFSSPRAQDMWDQRFAQLMQAPAVQKAAMDATKRGANRAAASGFQAVKNPFVEQNGRFMLRVNRDGSVAKPTLQFWDQVKRNLDGDIGVAQRAGDKTLAADLMALKSNLVNTLDSTVPEYKAARQGAAAWFGAEDAVDAGRMFAKSTRSIPEFKRGILAMKPAEREAFETGFASELIDQARSAGDRTNVITRMFKSPEQRAKMEMAFGPARAREIEAFVRVETAMDAFRNAFGNSTTARQLAEMGVIGGGAWLWTGDYKTGITAAALTQGARYAGKKIDGNVMTKMAEMLLSNDPALVTKAVHSATMSPQYMAAIDALTQIAGASARAASMSLPQQMGRQ